MTDEQWDDLMIPVNMVYIFYSFGSPRPPTTGSGEHTQGEAGVEMREGGRPQGSLPHTSPPPPLQRVMAFYPSPAGAMESLLSLEGWDELVRSNPILNDLEPDVEALLINRVQNRGGDSYREHFIVPIDACYELVGLIRLKWKGLSGGEEVWTAIAEFFTNLRTKSQPVRPPLPADKRGEPV